MSQFLAIGPYPHSLPHDFTTCYPIGGFICTVVSNMIRVLACLWSLVTLFISSDCPTSVTFYHALQSLVDLRQAFTFLSKSSNYQWCRHHSRMHLMKLFLVSWEGWSLIVCNGTLKFSLTLIVMELLIMEIWQKLHVHSIKEVSCRWGSLIF